MALVKLKIKPLPPSKLAEKFGKESIEVLFNPNTYSITKQVAWRTAVSATPTPATAQTTSTQRRLNAPILEFSGGQSRVLTLNLFFDVTEPVFGKRDVREETNKIVLLTLIERVKPNPQPPICEVSWGAAPPPNSDFPFKGVVSSLTQNFTLFAENGAPVRANLTVAFTEFLVPEDDQRQTDPELTTHVIKRGDTLSSIAGAVYRNPAHWRLIAEANQLDDPRRLEIGRRLTIPKL